MDSQHYPLRSLFALLHLRGEDLLLREVGERAFPHLKAALSSVPIGHALWLDSGGVRVMDTSFLDETVVELMHGLVAGEYGDRYLILREPSAATVDNLEGTMARRGEKMAVLVQRGDEIEVVGHVEPNLLETWSRARHQGALTARELADALGSAINTASMRLRKLYDAHLLSRIEELTPDGHQHVYRVPS